MGKIPMWQKALGLAGIGFGLMSVLAGGSVVLSDGTARELAGEIIPAVVWFNFLTGPVYVLAGVAILLDHPTARMMSALLSAAILGVSAHLLWQIVIGTAFEMRTVAAMSLRLIFWTGAAVLLIRHAGHARRSQ
ncbi:MAG: hypothetical protein WBO55_00485 [Rhizobiaceae bacterium]